MTAPPLPLPLDELRPDEVERLRPVLARLAWERHVVERVREEVAGGRRKREACRVVAEQECVAAQRSVSPRTVRRIAFGQ